MNAVLHHCALPAMRVPTGARPRAALFPDDAEAGAGDAEDDAEDGDELDDGDDEAAPLLAPLLPPPGAPGGGAPVLRPGIVHRLDKGCDGRRGRLPPAQCAPVRARC